MVAQSDKTVNIIRGKSLVKAASPEDVSLLLEHIDALEELLDGADLDDVFGSEGWRHRLGVDED
jgi:hypothetical protein